MDGSTIYAKWENEFQESVHFTIALLNHTKFFDTLLTELLDYQVGLHNFGTKLDDALASLTKGFILATLVPPEALLKLLNIIRVDGMQEAIPRAELSAFYGFELVENVVMTESTINLLINMPMHYAGGLYRVYKAMLILLALPCTHGRGHPVVPQPIDEGTTVTRYVFEQNQFVQSERKDSFAEATEQELGTHCQGTSRLRLGLLPVAMLRSSKSSCLASLFFNLQSKSDALRMCPQEVTVLPKGRW